MKRANWLLIEAFALMPAGTVWLSLGIPENGLGGMGPGLGGPPGGISGPGGPDTGRR